MFLQPLEISFPLTWIQTLTPRVTSLMNIQGHYFVWRHVSSLMTLGRHVCIVWQHSFRFDIRNWYFDSEKGTGLPLDKKLSINVMRVIKIRSGKETEWANRIYSIASFLIFTFLHRSFIVFVDFFFQQMYIFCWHFLSVAQRKKYQCKQYLWIAVASATCCCA
jgi:hypothetical protein